MIERVIDNTDLIISDDDLKDLQNISGLIERDMLRYARILNIEEEVYGQKWQNEL